MSNNQSVAALTLTKESSWSYRIECPIARQKEVKELCDEVISSEIGSLSDSDGAPRVLVYCWEGDENHPIDTVCIEIKDADETNDPIMNIEVERIIHNVKMMLIGYNRVRMPDQK